MSLLLGNPYDVQNIPIRRWLTSYCAIVGALFYFVLVGYQWFRFADCRLDTVTSARMDVAFSVRCPVPFFHLDPLSQLLLDHPHGKQTTSATMHQVGISLFYIICVNI